MARGQGGFVGSIKPLSTPNKPTGLSVEGGVGISASFTAPTNTGDSAITSYIATAVDESTGESPGTTGSSSPINITVASGGTFKVRVQAVNDSGPGRLTEFETGIEAYASSELYSWGTNGSGTLGLNDVIFRSSPVQIGALTTWNEFGTSQEVVHAVKTDNTLWAWGIGTRHHIGNNDTANRSSPIQIGALTNWGQPTGGQYNAGAVKTDGTIWVWGRRHQGQLGNSTSQINGQFVNSPIQVGSETDWKSIHMNGRATFVHAIKTDGSLYAWGNNGSGQLGTNDVIGRSSPVQIGALTTWSKISGGNYHSLGLMTDNTMFVWGYNSFGNLGQNNQAGVSSPVQLGSAEWADIGGNRRSSFAIKTNGTLWAIGGQNNQGQLGIGNAIDQSSPIQVGALTNWSKLPITNGTTNGWNSGALKTDGTLWIWGDGSQGSRGDNSVLDTSSPVQVGSDTNWFRIALGPDSGSVIAMQGN